MEVSNNQPRSKKKDDPKFMNKRQLYLSVAAALTEKILRI
jgi:hypothetical protein